MQLYINVNHILYSPCLKEKTLVMQRSKVGALDMAMLTVLHATMQQHCVWL